MPFLSDVHFLTGSHCKLHPNTQGPSKAYTFGGVVDDEEELAMSSEFQNSFYTIKYGERMEWRPVTIDTPMVEASSSRPSDDGEDAPSRKKGGKSSQGLPGMIPGLATPSDDEDGGDGGAAAAAGGGAGGGGSKGKGKGGGGGELFSTASKPPMPSPRISTHLTIAGSELYLYGGTVEIGPRAVALSDMYSIDLKKTSVWMRHHGNDRITDKMIEEADAASDESSSEEEDSDDDGAPKKGKGKKKGMNQIKQQQRTFAAASEAAADP
jgi:hypothetical protein